MSSSRSKGFTLLELLVTMVITAILMVLIVGTFVQFDRTANRRQKTNTVQAQGRNGVAFLERWARGGSLGVTHGQIRCKLSGGGVGDRPAVEVYKAVPGGRFVDVKPNTDVLLVVSAGTRRAVGGPGPVLDSTIPIPVTDVTQFSAGVNVLVSDWDVAGWQTVTNTVPGAPPAGQLVLGVGGDPNVLPTFNPNSQATVTVAAARMFYVNTNDDLIEWTLAVPRMPANAGEGLSRERIAQGFENLQLDVQVDLGSGPIPRLVGGGLSVGDPISQEAIAALGGGTPLLSVNDQVLVRTITLNALVRSATPLPDVFGDPAITIDGVGPLPTLINGVAQAPTINFTRRAYRLSLAVRNVSLGVF
jgi:prepilin-type N-terminal cleavage/methylation domain-containing protein